MPSYSNLDCILDKIDVVNPCTADQSAVDFFLDDLGLSLATTSKAADERYITGQSLVDNKKRIALDEVYSYLTQNVNGDCDFDKADGILCESNYVDRIARTVWYKTAALIYKEIAIDSKRYNEIIQFAGQEALAQMVYYDSSLNGFTNLENVEAGMYQKELEKIDWIRTYIEQQCCGQCSGGGWSITIP